MPPALTFVDDVREAEARLRRDRRLANELISLLDAAIGAEDSAVRLAATQACRSLFTAWAEAGELRIGPPGPETQELVAAEVAAATTAAAGDGDASRRAQALQAYRDWLEDKYRRFVADLRSQLRSAEAAPALRSLALDSLMLLAAAEVRCARPDRGLHHPALGAASGAFSQAVVGMSSSRTPLPPSLLRRFSDAYACNLDVAFYLMRHVQRLARPAATTSSSGSSRPERLLQLMTQVTPPSSDVTPSEARFLVPPAAADEGEGGGWPTAARCLLQRRRHQKEFCDAWRALLKLPLPRHAYRQVLSALPDAVLPHVPRPLRFCDLLSDGYSRGGVEALLSLKGLFVLMHKHNLEYPHFYRQLYTLVTPASISGAQRGRFATELDLFLSSSGLPAYLSAAFAKRLGRIALGAAPSGAALALGLAYNLLLRQPPVCVLIHRPLDAIITAAHDAFDETETDPRLCGALDSCLWEVDTLRQHYCPTVSSVAKMFARPFSHATPKMDLAPLSALSADVLMQVELKRRVKRAPLASAPTQPAAGGSSGLPKQWVE
jgi:U3 small nucleolar RNA-associated protein 19